jgi:hypothetical protein
MAEQKQIVARIEGITKRVCMTLQSPVRYENVRIECEVTGSFGDCQSYEELDAELWELAKESVKKEAEKIKAKWKAGTKGNEQSQAAQDAPPEDNSPEAMRERNLPKTLGDLVTPKQLWMIRSLGREIGCDVEQECKALTFCAIEEISKRAASSLIDYLKKMQEQGGPPEPSADEWVNSAEQAISPQEEDDDVPF